MLQNLDKKVLASGLVVAIAFVIAASAFKENRPTCNNFIFNTYAYVTFMTVWIIACNLYFIDYVKTNPKSNNNNNNNNTLFLVLSPINMILLFIVSIVLLYQVMTTPAEQVVRKHTLLLLFLSVFSIFTVRLTQRIQNQDPQALARLATTFFSIVVAASVFAFSFPNMIKTWWIFALLVALIGIIIARITMAILGYSKSSPENQTLSTFGAFIFTLFIAYDTKVAAAASRTCREGKADYIRYSTDLFLDFLNLFSNLEDLS